MTKEEMIKLNNRLKPYLDKYGIKYWSITDELGERILIGNPESYLMTDYSHAKIKEQPIIVLESHVPGVKYYTEINLDDKEDKIREDLLDALSIAQTVFK